VNRFNPGQVAATPGAYREFEASGVSLSRLRVVGEYWTSHPFFLCELE